MAACLKFQTTLFYRILVGNKSPNKFSCCRIRLYNTTRWTIVVNTKSTRLPNWKRCLMSTKAAATNIAEVKSIRIAVCIQRLPVLTPSKSDLELQYEELQEQLEFEHSSISDYELNEITMAEKREKLKKDEDNEKLKKEVAALDSEYQELKDIEEQHIKDITLASRMTEADLRDDKGTPLRKLEVPLFLLISNNDNSKTWQMPQGDVKPGESLRQAAERIARESVSSDMELQFLSNAPAGVYRKADKDGEPGSPKIFFYQAQLQRAIQKYNNDSWPDCIWASKDELSEYLPLNYYQSVVKFLL